MVKNAGRRFATIGAMGIRPRSLLHDANDLTLRHRPLEE